MKQLCTILAVVWCSVAGLNAQHSIQSMVFDSQNGLALEQATVRLYTQADSAYVQGTKTGTNGEFLLSKIKPGRYRLNISLMGYKNYNQNVVVDAKNLILKNIHMIESAHKLGEVEVRGTAAQLVVKGDTTEYNATAFKTSQNAVVEELLKKMPGVEVSADGKITVNGQEIKKIRVDGKKFFDGDIEMATKNLPAEMIEKVQVYDNKSDMAKLTGFEDNDTERIINLTTKSNRKHGYFGNVTGGAGSDLGNQNNDARYDANAFLNIMNNDTQTAITGGANNTNNSRSSRGRSGMGSPTGGITETQNIGINSNSTVNKKLTVGGDVSFNHSDNQSETSSLKNSYLRNIHYTNNDSAYANKENYMLNVRTEMEWKPDSVNTILIQPNMNYNRSFSNGNSNYVYMTETDTSSIGNSNSHGNGNAISAAVNLIYNHKFKSKPGRNLTVNVQSGISNSNSDTWNYSYKDAVQDNEISLVDQYVKNKSDQYNMGMRISFVEPLWGKKDLLEASLSTRMTSSKSVKDQFNKDADGNYTVNDTIYGNTFKNNFYNESLELNYRHVATNYNYMLGFKAEPSQTVSTRMYHNGENVNNNLSVINFSPTARFQYNITKKKFARIDYRGQTNQPSISQMQPVRNNSNLMNEVVGNMSLKPEFNHNLRLFYSAYDEVHFSSFNVMLNAQATKDALVTNSIYDGTGKQYSQTLNAKEIPYSFNANVMYNTPLVQKRLHFNTNTGLSTSRKIGYSLKNVTDSIDVNDLMKGDLSDTKQYSASEALALTFTTDVVELGARTSYKFSNTYNKLTDNTQNTTDWSVGGNFVAHLPYSFNISTDLNYSTMTGYAGFDNDQLIWNASLDKSLFNSKGTLALKVFDILHQQHNVRQTVGDNYIQYTKSNTITSYFLLSFAYRINEFKGNKRDRHDFNRFGPPDGGGDRPPMRRGGGGGGFDGPPPM